MNFNHNTNLTFCLHLHVPFMMYLPNHLCTSTKWYPHKSGVCNFGMLNYYLGKRAADEGRDSRYPHIDFCKDPDAICNREEHSELKWIGEC